MDSATILPVILLATAVLSVFFIIYEVIKFSAHWVFKKSGMSEALSYQKFQSLRESAIWRYLNQPAFPPMPEWKAGFLIFTSAALVLAGVYLMQRQQSAHEHFIRTDAKVISSEIVYNPGAYQYGPEQNYGARIHYSYSVKGHTYTADNYELTESTADFYSRAEAAAFLKNYRAGKATSAWYNPAQPSQAVLNNPSPLADTNSLQFELRGLVLALLTLAYGIFGLRHRKAASMTGANKVADQPARHALPRIIFGLIWFSAIIFVSTLVMDIIYVKNFVPYPHGKDVIAAAIDEFNRRNAWPILVFQILLFSVLYGLQWLPGVGKYKKPKVS